MHLFQVGEVKISSLSAFVSLSTLDRFSPASSSVSSLSEVYQ